MTYKCLECGHIFEEGEEGHYYESGYWGAPYSQKITCCPLCKGDYEETTPCDICGNEHLEYELIDGICGECVDSFSTDIDICYKIGKKDERTINLNGFLATIFEQSAIEDILYNFLKSREKTEKVDCSEYINEDLDWFIKEVKEVECEEKS